MGKARALSVEETIEKLIRLAEQPQSDEKLSELRRHLSSKSNLIVAKVAQIASDSGDFQLLPDLIDSFQRFMVNPAKSDKGCAAKTAIIKSLLAAECDREDIFLSGIRHVQFEPSYGGPIDTAAELRALSALGLVQMGSSETITELATLLADKEADARIGAVHALAHSRPEAAAALLRFKVLVGDSEPAVVSECFKALMIVSPKTSLTLIGDFISPKCPDLCEAAALALGESRMTEALDLLLEKWSKTFDQQFRRTLLLPIALARQTPSLDFLLSVVETADTNTAAAAISVLRIYNHDRNVRERVEAAIDDSGREVLRSVFEKEFG